MSTLKVNKIRATAGSADSITLDPNGGAVIAGVTTVSTIKVGSGVTISSDGDVFHTGVCTATSFVGDAASLTQVPAANLVGVCTSGFTKTGGFGVVLQVKQTVKTDTFSSTTTGSDVDITGLSVSITPTSASNKILVTYDTNISGSNAGYSGNIHLKRGSTKIYQGDAEGSRTRSTQFFITRNDTIGHLETIKVHGSFLDSPNTTSETTYKLSINAINTHTTVNKTMYDDNQAGVARVPSTITVMEIAA